MNILSNTMLTCLLACTVVCCSVSCNGDQSAANSKATKQAAPIYVATALDCDYQKYIAVSQRPKLLIFDPTGIFPENLYATSPSYKIKTEILSQKDFRDMVSKKCDLFFVTQDCPEGAKLTKELKVTNFPTFMLLSQDGNVLYKKEKLTTLEDLYIDIKTVL